jgi:GT2 family glycosyltransferase
VILRPPGDGRHPTVSVVSVNYNGRSYLDRFLQSVLALDYPPACYRVAIVDNASTDGSVELLRKQFPQVCLVQAGRNLGFAGGCNLGIRATASDYVALVNNDTVVEPSWLRALVEVAESDPRVGLVGSKILFLTPFLDIGLETLAAGSAGPSVSGAPVLLLHEARVVGCDYDKLVVRAGHLAASAEAGRFVRTLAGSARLAVPVTRADAPATLELTVRAASSRNDLSVAVMVGDAEISRVAVTDTPRTIRLEASREIVTRAARDLINNAGTRIDGGGRFGDRGIFEFDHGQYDRIADVPALCGASVLLRRTMLEQIGGFDTRYFMYFEDVDLSWRARRSGWRLLYTPHSRLRHVHAGTSGEGSPLWAFFVARNHLFWLIKHGTARAALRAVSVFYVRVAVRALRAAVSRLRRRTGPDGTVELQIARSLTRYLPGLVVSRYRSPRADGTGRWTAVGNEGPASA